MRYHPLGLVHTLAALAALAVLTVSTLPGSVLAAPTTDASPPSPNATPANTSVLNGGAVRSGSRSGEASTIDMLVEMQQPSAGLQFNERQRAAEARARAGLPPLSLPQGLPAAGPGLGAAPARQDAPPVSAAGLFGSGATPQVQQQQSAPRPTTSSAVGGDGAAAPAPRSVSTEAHNPRLSSWLALPREIIEYVRENRAFVLGSVAAFLVAAWSGSLLVARLRG